MLWEQRQAELHFELERRRWQPVWPSGVERFGNAGAL